jgi:hypothetical protein
MQLNSIKSVVGSWVNPACPGYGKSPVVGFLMGFFLGPIGIGIFLRSVVDFGLSLIMCMALLGAFDFKAAPVCWLACGVWILGRIKLDTRRMLESRSTAETRGTEHTWEATTESHPGSV